jgi:pyruvate dehydrogenase E1 component beta subunit
MSTTKNGRTNVREPIKYADALKEATEQLLVSDPRVLVLGLGVPQGTGGVGSLAQIYPNRVLDMPTSEAALTGLAVGASIGGLRPIVFHDRVEFSLLASDQMFTQAAKWRYMFGGNGGSAPVTLRIVVGRQWGNGPQHSQAFYGMFGGVMGLRVVIPSSPYTAKGLLIAAVRADDPVVMLEPRWLYGVKEQVPEELYEVSLNKARIIKKGSDITVVSYGDALFAARQALELIGDTTRVELIDLVSLNPIDHKTISASLKKTRRLLTVDTTSSAFSVGSEVIAKAVQGGVEFMVTPQSLACPDVPCPTSSALSEFWYPTKVNVANAILNILNKPKIDTKLTFEELHMAPTVTL